mmetsp:Transcript_14109/g.25179  ORF Transcript_14109/g.25179 Transcript_14109/m.25179 type:complete len:117 (+) Transcript_14109:686-1036(+)
MEQYPQGQSVGCTTISKKGINGLQNREQALSKLCMNNCTGNAHTYPQNGDTTPPNDGITPPNVTPLLPTTDTTTPLAIRCVRTTSPSPFQGWGGGTITWGGSWDISGGFDCTHTPC